VLLEESNQLWNYLVHHGIIRQAVVFLFFLYLVSGGRMLACTAMILVAETPVWDDPASHDLEGNEQQQTTSRPLTEEQVLGSLSCGRR
jgi:hypothetical protein